MRFWDSSAIVPLLVGETSTRAIQEAYEADPEVVVWWATEVECVSALARREREEALSHAGMADALDRLDHLARSWREIQPVEPVRRVAARLLRTHPLSTADAFQLAAARAAAEEQPATLPFVTLDERLEIAAQREGFSVILPAL